jgi:hypothetical protein
MPAMPWPMTAIFRGADADDEITDAYLGDARGAVEWRRDIA